MSDDDTIPLISEEDEEMEELHTFASSTDNSESQPERTDDEIQLQHQFHYFPPSDDIIEEEEIQVGLPTRPGKPAIVLMGCCPCLSNNPCSDDKKLEYKSIPKTTVFFLSVIQIGLFILSIFIGGFAPLYENWMIGPSGETLVGMGAKYGPLIRYKFEVWRLISPVFLHAGIIQLVVNIFYQLRMGLYLEPRWGWAKFVIVYFTSGFAGVALSCVTNPNSVSVAASFSMIGIMGAWFSQLHMTWESMEGWQKKMNLTVCLVVILITIGEGLGPSYVDTAGHIGGLLMGTALGYLFFGWNNATFHQDKLLARVILLAGSLFVLLYSFVTMGFFYTMISVDPLPEQESMDDEYIMSNSTIIDTYAFISTNSSTSSYFGISSLTTSSPEVPTSYK